MNGSGQEYSSIGPWQWVRTSEAGNVLSGSDLDSNPGHDECMVKLSKMDLNKNINIVWRNPLG